MAVYFVGELSLTHWWLCILLGNCQRHSGGCVYCWGIVTDTLVAVYIVDELSLTLWWLCMLLGNCHRHSGGCVYCWGIVTDTVVAVYIVMNCH